jgi:hypothetical protein
MRVGFFPRLRCPFAREGMPSTIDLFQKTNEMGLRTTGRNASQVNYTVVTSWLDATTAWYPCYYSAHSPTLPASKVCTYQSSYSVFAGQSQANQAYCYSEQGIPHLVIPKTWGRVCESQSRTGTPAVLAAASFPDALRRTPARSLPPRSVPGRCGWRVRFGNRAWRPGTVQGAGSQHDNKLGDLGRRLFHEAQWHYRRLDPQGAPGVRFMGSVPRGMVCEAVGLHGRIAEEKKHHHSVPTLQLACVVSARRETDGQFYYD